MDSSSPHIKTVLGLPFLSANEFERGFFVIWKISTEYWRKISKY